MEFTRQQDETSDRDSIESLPILIDESIDYVLQTSETQEEEPSQDIPNITLTIEETSQEPVTQELTFYEPPRPKPSPSLIAHIRRLRQQAKRRALQKTGGTNAPNSLKALHQRPTPVKNLPMFMDKFKTKIQKAGNGAGTDAPPAPKYKITKPQVKNHYVLSPPTNIEEFNVSKNVIKQGLQWYVDGQIAPSINYTTVEKELPKMDAPHVSRFGSSYSLYFGGKKELDKEHPVFEPIKTLKESQQIPLSDSTFWEHFKEAKIVLKGTIKTKMDHHKRTLNLANYEYDENNAYPLLSVAEPTKEKIIQWFKKCDIDFQLDATTIDIPTNKDICLGHYLNGTYSINKKTKASFLAYLPELIKHKLEGKAIEEMEGIFAKYGAGTATATKKGVDAFKFANIMELINEGHFYDYNDLNKMHKMIEPTIIKTIEHIDDKYDTVFLSMLECEQQEKQNNIFVKRLKTKYVDIYDQLVKHFDNLASMEYSIVKRVYVADDSQQSASSVYELTIRPNIEVNFEKYQNIYGEIVKYDKSNRDIVDKYGGRFMTMLQQPSSSSDSSSGSNPFRSGPLGPFELHTPSLGTQQSKGDYVSSLDTQFHSAMDNLLAAPEKKANLEKRKENEQLYDVNPSVKHFDKPVVTNAKNIVSSFMPIDLDYRDLRRNISYTFPEKEEKPETAPATTMSKEDIISYLNIDSGNSMDDKALELVYDIFAKGWEDNSHLELPTKYLNNLEFYASYVKKVKDQLESNKILSQPLGSGKSDVHSMMEPCEFMNLDQTVSPQCPQTDYVVPNWARGNTNPQATIYNPNVFANPIGSAAGEMIHFGDTKKEPERPYDLYRMKENKTFQKPLYEQDANGMTMDSFVELKDLDKHVQYISQSDYPTLYEELKPGGQLAKYYPHLITSEESRHKAVVNLIDSDKTLANYNVYFVFFNPKTYHSVVEKMPANIQAWLDSSRESLEYFFVPEYGFKKLFYYITNDEEISGQLMELFDGKCNHNNLKGKLKCLERTIEIINYRNEIKELKAGEQTKQTREEDSFKKFVCSMVENDCYVKKSLPRYDLCPPEMQLMAAATDATQTQNLLKINDDYYELSEHELINAFVANHNGIVGGRLSSMEQYNLRKRVAHIMESLGWVRSSTEKDIDNSLKIWVYKKQRPVQPAQPAQPIQPTQPPVCGTSALPFSISSSLPFVGPSSVATTIPQEIVGLPIIPSSSNFFTEWFSAQSRPQPQNQPLFMANVGDWQTSSIRPDIYFE